MIPQHFQIYALTALKATDCEAFVEEIAVEMTSATRRVYGHAFQLIIPIPGGSSGKEVSLSVRLAKRIAVLLNILHISGLDCRLLIGAQRLRRSILILLLMSFSLSWT